MGKVASNGVSALGNTASTLLVQPLKSIGKMAKSAAEGSLQSSDVFPSVTASQVLPSGSPSIASRLSARPDLYRNSNTIPPPDWQSPNVTGVWPSWHPSSDPSLAGFSPSPSPQASSQASSQQLILAPPYNPSDISQGLKTPSSKMSRLTKDYSSPSVLPRIEECTTPNQPGVLPDLTSVVERQMKKERKSQLSSRSSSGYISAPETYSNVSSYLQTPSGYNAGYSTAPETAPETSPEPIPPDEQQADPQGLRTSYYGEPNCGTGTNTTNRTITINGSFRVS